MSDRSPSPKLCSSEEDNRVIHISNAFSGSKLYIKIYNNKKSSKMEEKLFNKPVSFRRKKT